MILTLAISIGTCGGCRCSISRTPPPAWHEVIRCREAFPNHYIKVSLYNRKLTKQSIALQFFVNRPQHEPGFRLERQEGLNRAVHYTLTSYAADRPHGERYSSDGSHESW